MASYERSYGTARSIFSLLEAISWLVTVAGIIAVIAGVVGLDCEQDAGDQLYAADAGVWDRIHFHCAGWNSEPRRVDLPRSSGVPSSERRADLSKVNRGKYWDGGAGSL